MIVLESIVIANFFPFTSTIILSLQCDRTSNQITTALVSFQYFVQEVGFQVFMADVSKSIPIPWTGTQQNPRVKHWDQASPYRIRKLNHENFFSCSTVQVQVTNCGLVYTGIPKTSDDGYGSMGQPLISLSGIVENQTMLVQTRIVWNLEVFGGGNGMMCHVVTVVLTFVKSVVSTTSFMNIYTIDGLKLVLSPGVLNKCLYGEAPSPSFHEKGTHFVYFLLTNRTSFTYPHT